MTDISATAFLRLVSGRRGHFRLESGHHSSLWLDLDPLFVEPRRIEPFVAALATALEPHEVSAVCGPLLGGAFVGQLVAQTLDADFYFTERVMPAEPQGMYRAQYRLPPALAQRLRGQRIAMVDDVMSAGSALRGTCAELQSHGAEPVVAGALLVLGRTGEDFFTERGIAVEAAARDDYELFLPAACPLCEAGVVLEDVASGTA
jgi:orotate phosphoribosyltransferase